LIKKTDGTIIARNIDIMDTYLSRMRGLMFKTSAPDDYAAVFKFDREKKVDLHMLFVPFNIHAVFLDKDNRVNKTRKMKAWTGRAKGRAKKIIEIPEKNYREIKKGEKLIIKNQ